MGRGRSASVVVQTALGVLGVAVTLAAACTAAPPPDPIADACGGTRPPLEDCTALGVYSADCGGEGDPVFACDEENGLCRWFAGACVAARHRASDCPVMNRCCHATDDGLWPFADGWMPAGTSIFASHRLREDVATIGRAPVTATIPANLDVTVDPSFVPSGPPSVECSAGGWCFATLWQFGLSRVHDTFAIELRPGRNGFAIIVEVVTRPGGSLLGRAFVTYENDKVPGPAPSHCVEPGPRALPVSGTLTIDQLAATGPVHGVLTLDVADGTVTVTF